MEPYAENMLLDFKDEPDQQVSAAEVEPWKVLIVDDDEEIHNVTRFAMKRFTFANRPILFFSAYSAGEGQRILQENIDIAVALVDVVMEKEDAGLQLVHYIRQNMKNQMIRIILRTGQPGMAPEQEVVVKYDINDYREKTELTSQKLHTTMITALRSYQDLNLIKSNHQGLEQIINVSAAVFKHHSLANLSSFILEGLESILRLNSRVIGPRLSGFLAVDRDGRVEVLAASGELEYLVGKNLEDLKPAHRQIFHDIKLAEKEQKNIRLASRLAVYFPNPRGEANFIYLQGVGILNEWVWRIIEAYAGNIHMAFDNLFLRDEMEETQKDFVYRLGEAIEVRSAETGNHVKRVAEFAGLMARRYGLADDEVNAIRLAAPIHDIGKLAIPDAILNKPGKLTVEEFRIIKTHTTIGYDMLKSSRRPITRAAAIIALQHHERYDGLGYPMGLKDHEIHIFGRIVALADVFDALGSRRVYKEAWDMKRIVDYIIQNRGTQFDPVFTDIMMNNLDDFINIKETLPD